MLVEVKKILKIAFPIVLGVVLMIWLYHDFDFSSFGGYLINNVDWWWMSVSLFFGAMGYLLRGVRWKQLLEPLGVNVSTSMCINSVFFGYMANVVVPRIGEVSRCGLLKRYEGVSFAKSLGTIVTERVIDTVCIVLLTVITFFMDDTFFYNFMDDTGTDASGFVSLLSSPMLYLIAGGVLLGGGIFVYFFRNFGFFRKVKDTLSGLVNGIFSVSRVRNPFLFILYTVGIWVCYYLHFYITFYCFDFSMQLGSTAGMVLFVLGSIAVIIPTPNGAGPWHYAMIVGMSLYGISGHDAGIFALIVHSIQTFLIALLGIYGLLMIQIKNKVKL